MVKKVILYLFLISLISVQVFAAYEKQYIKEQNKVIVKDSLTKSEKFILTHISTTTPCLNCETIYELETKAGVKLKPKNFAYNFMDEYNNKKKFNKYEEFATVGDIKLKDISIKILQRKNITKYIPVYTECNDNNSCIDHYDEHTEEVERYEDFNSENILEIKPYEKVTLKVMGSMQPYKLIDHSLEISGVEFEEFAWWNSSYGNRSLINTTVFEVNDLIKINGSTGFTLPGSSVVQHVWTLKNESTLYLYYNDFDTWDIGSETEGVNFHVEQGNRSSVNSEAMWDSVPNLVSVWLFGGNADDGTGENDGTLQGAASLKSTGCYSGGCVDLTTNGGDYISMTESSIPNGSASRSLQCWVNYTDVATDDGIFMGMGTTNQYKAFGLAANTQWYIRQFGYDISTGVNPATNKWYFLTLGMNSSQNVFAKWNYTSIWSGDRSNTNTDGAPFRIGTAGYDTVSDVIGIIDDCFLWDNYDNSRDIEIIGTYRTDQKGYGNLEIGQEDAGGTPVTTKPVMQDVTVTSDDTFYETADLNCNATATDVENLTFDFILTWHVNGVDLGETTYTNKNNNTNTYLETLSNANFDVGDAVNCTVRAYDGTNTSTNMTINVTIANQVPTWTQDIPNVSVGHYDNISLNINVTDGDTSQDIEYFINDSKFSINNDTGLITDDPAESEIRNWSVLVNATDGIEMITFVFNIEIHNSSGAGSSDPNTTDFCSGYVNATLLNCTCGEGYYQNEGGFCAKQGGFPSQMLSFTPSAASENFWYDVQYFLTEHQAAVMIMFFIIMGGVMMNNLKK
jgi:hypothetical protein